MTNICTVYNFQHSSTDACVHQLRHVVCYVEVKFHFLPWLLHSRGVLPVVYFPAVQVGHGLAQGLFSVQDLWILLPTPNLFAQVASSSGKARCGCMHRSAVRHPILDFCRRRD